MFGSMEEAETQPPVDRIYRAALECFTRHGVRKTTMDEIARVAGLSRPTIYYYFKDKQAVILDVVLRQQAEAHRVHKEALKGRFSGLEAIIEAVAMGINRAKQDPYSFRLSRPDAEKLTAAALQSEAARELRATYWGPMLAEARKSGEMRHDLSDEEVIHWIIFLQFTMVTNGDLFGLSSKASIRNALEKFLRPVLKSTNE